VRAHTFQRSQNLRIVVVNLLEMLRQMIGRLEIGHAYGAYKSLQHHIVARHCRSRDILAIRNLAESLERVHHVRPNVGVSPALRRKKRVSLAAILNVTADRNVKCVNLISRSRNACICSRSQNVTCF